MPRTNDINQIIRDARVETSVENKAESWRIDLIVNQSKWIEN